MMRVRRGDGLRLPRHTYHDGARKDVRDVQRHAGQVVVGLDLLDGALDLTDVVRDILRDVIPTSCGSSMPSSSAFSRVMMKRVS